MVVAFAVPAMAADAKSILNAELDKLAALYTTGPAVNAISQARQYLANNPNANDITVAQANAIAGNIQSAVTAAGSAKTWAELEASGQLAAVQGFVTAAAGQLGWTVAFGTGTTAVTVRDADGNVVLALTAGVIKQTGIDSTMLITIIVGITALFGAAVVVAVVTRKKRVVNEAA